MDKKYVIGIDFGHGETSAAYCDLEDIYSEVHDIEIQRGDVSIPSTFFIPSDSNKSELLGREAIQHENIGKGTIFVGFKQKPQIPPKDVEKSNAWCKYMHKVYREIVSNRELPFHSNDYVIYIAKPSSWKAKAESRYYDYVAKPEYAGLPLEGPQAIVNESRAAFISAQHSEKAKIVGGDFYRGCVVIDMGSSTVDMTYISDSHYPNQKKSGYYLKDDGYYCGASIIEEAILDCYVDNSAELRDLLYKDERLKYPLLYEIRKVKEDYFSSPEHSTKKKTIYLDKYNGKGKIIIEISKDTINRYTGDYQLKFKEALGKYIISLEKELGDKPKIYCVILTGGASRMDFAKEIVSKEWGIGEDYIFSADNPSLTVSRGIAEVARMDILTRGMKEDVEQLIKSKLTDQNINNEVVPLFLKNLINTIKEECLKIIKEKEFVNFDALSKEISKTCEEVLSDNLRIQEQLQDAVDSDKVIREKTNRIIKYYSVLGVDENSLTKIIDISNIKSVILDPNGIPKILKDMQESIGYELCKEKESIWDRFCNFWSRLFESKKHKEARERLETSLYRTRGGLANFTSDDKKKIYKKNLSDKICDFFERLQVGKQDTCCGPSLLNDIRSCSEQYLYGLLYNIDHVRKEITDNE